MMPHVAFGNLNGGLATSAAAQAGIAYRIY